MMVLGADLSGGHAMAAFAGYWPETGRFEAMAAFPDTPSLKARGEYDGVGSLYEQMAQRGELIVDAGPFGGRAHDAADGVDRVGVAGCCGGRPL